MFEPLSRTPSPPPSFWAPVTGTPDGLMGTPDGPTGEVGAGVLRYPNTYQGPEYPDTAGNKFPNKVPEEKWENRENGGKWGKMGGNGETGGGRYGKVRGNGKKR